MKEFGSKIDAFNYLKNKFLKRGVKGIVVQGSTAKGKIKEFSDIDLVVFNNKKIKPYYELVLISDKLTLISSYFYKPGKVISTPKNGYIIYGAFYSQQEHHRNTIYTRKERLRRDNQMFLDCLFKYLRSKDKSFLDYISKYSRV